MQDIDTKDINLNWPRRRLVRASEDIVNRIGKFIPGMLAYWSADLSCKFASQSYLEWFGKTEQQMASIKLPELLGPTIYARNEPYILGALQGKKQEFERTLTKADGSVAHTWAQYVPDIESGYVVGFVVLVSDVTTLVKMEQQLNQEREARLISQVAQREAEAANAMKTSFLASISHEIKTPITVIQGYAELLLQHLDTHAELKSYVSSIAHASEHMKLVVGDVLDITHIEAGRMQLEQKPTELLPLLQEVFELLCVRADQAGLSLRLHSCGPLPEVIDTDPLRFKQILLNVIGNACKFTKEGGVEVECVWQRPRMDQARIKIRVKDTGIGIAPDKIGCLFAEYAQADGTIRSRFGGTGLGLNLSRKLARLMGGDVEIEESIEGKGSIFAVTIPGPSQAVEVRIDLNYDPNQSLPLNFEAKPSPIEAEHAPRCSGSLQGKKILLIDDAPDVLALIQHFLQRCGAEVTAVESGFQALALAEKNRFDSILCDINLPTLSGYELAALIRRQGFRGQILAVTASSMAEDKARYLAAGFSDKISKPINFQSLVATLASQSVGKN